jgi:hypothetical protein
MAQKEAHRIRADALLLLPKQNQKHRRALFFSSGNNLSVSTTFVLSLPVLANGYYRKELFILLLSKKHYTEVRRQHIK